MKLNKKLLGGDSNNSINTNSQLQTFISIIIVGYFGIKIVYGYCFGYYPQKYYYTNININTNEEDLTNSSSVVLNSYIPGIWNNEISDFVTLMVLLFIVYVYNKCYK